MTPEERQALRRVFDLMLRPASRTMAKKALDRSTSRAALVESLVAHPHWFEDWPATLQQIGRMAGAEGRHRDVATGSQWRNCAENRPDMMILLAHVAEPPAARNVIDRMLQAPLRRRR